MQNQLETRMKEKGYSELTMYQKKRDLIHFFGDQPSFQRAYETILKIKEIHKRANVANKVHSIMKLLPDLIPEKETYESFLKQQKEWNVKRNEYYTKKDNSVTNHMKELMETCKKKQEAWQNHKGSEKEMKYLIEYCMCMMYILMPEYIGRSVEIRNLKLRKEGNDRTQNYVTPTKLVFGTYKQSSKKEQDGTIVKLKSGIVKIPLPKELQEVVKRMRRISNQTYIFGEDKVLSQSGFHFMQKRVMGFTTNQLRKILAQHREGIQKSKMQKVSEKMGNTIETLMKFYV